MPNCATPNGPAAIGWRVYGLGIVALAAIGLAIGDFLPGQPAPKSLPDRVVLAAVANGFLLLAGLAVGWHRLTARAAAAIAAYYAVIVVVLMNGRVVLAHLGTFGAYSGAAEQLAIAAGGLIVYATSGKLTAVDADRLVRIGQVAFGLCAILFGIAHFVYMDLTVPLVPKWLPPNVRFWAVATGVFNIAAGLAIVSGVWSRSASVLLTIMFATFAVLVHLPMLLATTADHSIWGENALNLALTGVAWAVADSLAISRRRARGSGRNGGAPTR